MSLTQAAQQSAVEGPQGSIFLPQNEVAQEPETQTDKDVLEEKFFAECFKDLGDPESILELIAKEYPETAVAAFCSRLQFQIRQLRGPGITQVSAEMNDFELQQYLLYIDRIIVGFLERKPRHLAAVALRQVV